ncbi:asparaginase domain-containing protein [Litorimonas haliclonae]|uniref:asparaginase domain-containing protein n=1 Tax=Litorimonas haliclonae TaxID=2081977 RepID=UPI0039EF58B4
MTDNIAIFITGGTLDKVHDTKTEGLIFDPKRKSRVSAILRQGRSRAVRQEVLFQIDSLDMTDDHREEIYQAVINAPEDHIIITHGTGTMELSAQYLDGKVENKTVILTGAMRPQSLGRSDAGFNLGGAMIAVQTLPAGVYGIMNGQVFEAQTLHKNTETGRFDD